MAPETVVIVAELKPAGRSAAKALDYYSEEAKERQGKEKYSE